MTATLYVHDISNPRVDHQPHITGLTFQIKGGSDLCIFLPRPVAEAMMAAFNAEIFTGYDALRAFIEELRDHKPEVISGRCRDPQDDVPDLMPLDEFAAFQADAEKLVGKKQKGKAA
jgi:hypothetical protein